MYMNSKDTWSGSTALLWTPPYAFPGQHCLTFYYFMHGSEIGSLQVYAIQSGGFVDGSTPVWTRVGPQGYEWKKAVTPIVADSNFQVQLSKICLFKICYEKKIMKLILSLSKGPNPTSN